MKTKTIVLLIMTLLSLKAYSSGRVLEVESHIRLLASQYMKTSYPNTNFSLEVKVSPRRVKKNISSDTLPFFGSEDLMQRDPWDDTSRSVFELMGRIRSVSLTVNFLERIKISDQVVFKKRLLKAIGLIPGRDKVNINIEYSSLIQKNVIDELSKSNNLIVFSGVIGFFIILISFSLIYLKFKKPSSQSSVEVDSQAASSFPPQSSMPTNSLNLDRSLKEVSKNEVTFTDPTGSLEIIKAKIEEIIRSGTFPNLNDMLILDDLLNQNERSFSFLIFEFKKEYQDIILKNGRGEKWYKGFCHAGELDKELFFTLDTMLRNRDLRNGRVYEDLLIQCWRMGDKLTDLLCNFSREHSLCVLSNLPKYISVPVAREVFPGGWGAVLSEEFNHKVPSSDECLMYTEKAKEVFPELDHRSLDLYKNRRDLLSYLMNCEVFEEQEVYKVLGEHSHFFNVRPPFYKLFELSSSDMREIIDSVSLENWAIALFNIRREYRVHFNNLLSDKEKYLLGTFLKELDSIPPTQQSRGLLRESIGKRVFSLKKDEVTFEGGQSEEMAA